MDTTVRNEDGEVLLLIPSTDAAATTKWKQIIKYCKDVSGDTMGKYMKDMNNIRFIHRTCNHLQSKYGRGEVSGGVWGYVRDAYLSHVSDYRIYKIFLKDNNKYQDIIDKYNIDIDNYNEKMFIELYNNTEFLCNYSMDYYDNIISDDDEWESIIQSIQDVIPKFSDETFTSVTGVFSYFLTHLVNDIPARERIHNILKRTNFKRKRDELQEQKQDKNSEEEASDKENSNNKNKKKEKKVLFKPKKSDIEEEEPEEEKSKPKPKARVKKSGAESKEDGNDSDDEEDDNDSDAEDELPEPVQALVTELAELQECAEDIDMILQDIDYEKYGDGILKILKLKDMEYDTLDTFLDILLNNTILNDTLCDITREFAEFLVNNNINFQSRMSIKNIVGLLSGFIDKEGLLEGDDDGTINLTDELTDLFGFDDDTETITMDELRDIYVKLLVEWDNGSGSDDEEEPCDEEKKQEKNKQKKKKQRKKHNKKSKKEIKAIKMRNKRFDGLINHIKKENDKIDRINDLFDKYGNELGTLGDLLKDRRENNFSIMEGLDNLRNIVIEERESNIEEDSLDISQAVSEEASESQSQQSIQPSTPPPQNPEPEPQHPSIMRRLMGGVSSLLSNNNNENKDNSNESVEPDTPTITMEEIQRIEAELDIRNFVYSDEELNILINNINTQKGRLNEDLHNRIEKLLKRIYNYKKKDMFDRCVEYLDNLSANIQMIDLTVRGCNENIEKVKNKDENIDINGIKTQFIHHKMMITTLAGSNTSNFYLVKKSLDAVKLLCKTMNESDLFDTEYTLQRGLAKYCISRAEIPEFINNIKELNKKTTWNEKDSAQAHRESKKLFNFLIDIRGKHILSKNNINICKKFLESFMDDESE